VPGNPISATYLPESATKRYPREMRVSDGHKLDLSPGAEISSPTTPPIQAIAPASRQCPSGKNFTLAVAIQRSPTLTSFPRLAFSALRDLETLVLYRMRPVLESDVGSGGGRGASDTAV
jgi:hypothetical protein